MPTPHWDWCRYSRHLTNCVGNNHTNPNVLQATWVNRKYFNSPLLALAETQSPNASSPNVLNKRWDILIFLQCRQ